MYRSVNQQQLKRKNGNYQLPKRQRIQNDKVRHWYAWDPRRYVSLKQLVENLSYGRDGPPMPVFIETSAGSSHSELLLFKA